MYILNIETSTKNCSVALSKNGATVAEKEFAGEGFSHAELLHVFIEEILANAKADYADLNAIAVSQGPGSYTGLRIGISAAKGLCFALDIPLIAVDTLTILASQAKITDGLVIPMIDARRMEVYSSVFDCNLNKKREVQAEVIDEFSFANITENIYIIGDCQEKIKTVLNKNNFIYLENIIYPSANEMSPLSFGKYTQQDFENLAYFEPFYLKDFLITSKKI
jgi:tRNA threonylcarbamoyladenosine biosynthesis protein TsaB